MIPKHIGVTAYHGGFELNEYLVRMLSGVGALTSIDTISYGKEKPLSTRTTIVEKKKVMTCQGIKHYSREIIKTFEGITDKHLDTAIKAAVTCSKTWRHTTFTERADVGAKAAAIIRARVDEFASSVTSEMGKLIEQALDEVVVSADIIDYYASNAKRFLPSEHLQPNSGEAEIVNTSLRVLFVQHPNFPYYQLASFGALNLMLGNIVMVKHAGCVPQCAIAFERLWLEAGAPEGAFTNC
jgi:succinate-semialdehyde dehydrogenase/glutarate-semialdehyde dehydrogenase